MEVRGLLETAGLEKLAADPTTNLFTGRIYLNTTSEVVRIYYGGVWNTVGGGASSTGNVNFQAFFDGNLDLTGVTAEAADYGYVAIPTTTPNDVARTITTPLVASGEFDNVGFKFFSDYFSDLTVGTSDGKLFRYKDGSTSATYLIRGKEFVVVYFDPGLDQWVVTDSPNQDIAPLQQAKRISADLDLEAFYVTDRVTNAVSRYDIPATIINESVANGTKLSVFDKDSTDPFITNKTIIVLNPTQYTMDLAAQAGQVITNGYDGSTSLTLTLAARSFAFLVNVPTVGYRIVQSNDPAIGQSPLSLGDLLDVSVASPEDGQALVYNAGGGNWVAGASGDASFKLQSIVGEDLTIKAGSLILDDERELYAAADITKDLTALGDGSYYFYIDLSLLPAETDVSGRKVYAITDAMITALTATPVTLRERQYVPLGGATQTAGVWGDLFSTAFRRHDTRTDKQKNYVLSPDTADNVTDVGGSTSTTTLVSSELPEANTKLRACKIVQTAGSIGDTSTFDTFDIDDSDGSCIGAPEAHWKTLGTYTDGDASLQWYNSVTAEILYTQDINVGTGRISKGVADIVLSAGEDAKPRIYWNVTDSDGLSLSGVKTLAETRLVGDGGVKQYDISSQLNLTTGGTIVLATGMPYKTVDDTWRVNLSVLVSGASNVTAHDFTVDGMKFSGGAFQAGTAAGGQDGGYCQSSTTGVDPAPVIVRYNTAKNYIRVHGDFEIEAKPTWADFDGSVMFGTEAQAQNASGYCVNDSGSVIGAGTAIPWDAYNQYDPGITFDGTDTFTCTTAMKINFTQLRVRYTAAASETMNVTNESGTIYEDGRAIINHASTDGIRMQGSCTVKFTAGQKFQIRAVNGGTLNSTASNTAIFFHRIADKSSKATGFPILGDSTTGTQDIGTVVKQDPTADIGGAPSQSDFNNLLQKLRDAGVLDT